ncbi:MAG TPA: hypothetical protein VE030_05590 [Burkholderiales bacterium]|nr:hypothetical protein [Burkholderiales bacterium]
MRGERHRVRASGCDYEPVGRIAVKRGRQRPVALSGLSSRFDRKNHAHKARRLAPIAALAVILLGILMPVLYAKFDA